MGVFWVRGNDTSASRTAAITHTSGYGYGERAGKVAVEDSRGEGAAAWSSVYSPWVSPQRDTPASKAAGQRPLKVEI